jgi:hypothetical protein
MKIELEEVLKHAQLAHFDNELTSFVILMITDKNEPELHMAVSQDDAYMMNGVTDMLKLELLTLMNKRVKERKPRS